MERQHSKEALVPCLGDSRRRFAALVLATAMMWCAERAQAATQVNVVGLFGSKALVSINGAPPRSLAPGQKTPEGVELIAVENGQAVMQIDGQQRSLKMGQMYMATTDSGAQSVSLTADSLGHFIARGSINGSTAEFLVDTGASVVAIPSNEAKRMGINYHNAPAGMVGTANGGAVAYRIKLDVVKIGTVSLNNVDAVVLEAPMPHSLLGMSFLNRMEMRRDGDRMTLTKRY